MGVGYMGCAAKEAVVGSDGNRSLATPVKVLVGARKIPGPGPRNVRGCCSEDASPRFSRYQDRLQNALLLANR